MWRARLRTMPLRTLNKGTNHANPLNGMLQPAVLTELGNRWKPIEPENKKNFKA
jgi:hypothetical protein